MQEAQRVLLLTIAWIVVVIVVAWLRWFRHGRGRWGNPPDVPACMGDWVIEMLIVLGAAVILGNSEMWAWSPTPWMIWVVQAIIPVALLVSTYNMVTMLRKLWRPLQPTRSAASDIDEQEETWKRFMSKMEENGQ